jgi:hypothetical protein
MNIAYLTQQGVPDCGFFPRIVFSFSSIHLEPVLFCVGLTNLAMAGSREEGQYRHVGV